MNREIRIFVFLLVIAQASLCAQFPAITNQSANRALRAGGNSTLAVGISGTGPFSCEWQRNGTNLTFNIITTVAGNGTPDYSGDGSAANNASLHDPADVTADSIGNLFIADCGNNRIRKVDTNGIITTVAGNGVVGYSGDGGTATSASLANPCCVAVDNSGNLFIADCGNNRIRKVNPNGIITTVAGNGMAGYSGDGGAANNASLYSPVDVTVDATGNLFIADCGTNRIRKVDANGIITTVAGNGIAGYSGDGGAATGATLDSPDALAVDAFNNLFIADTQNNRIRKVCPNGIITTVAGNGIKGDLGDGGPAANASLNLPHAVRVDSAGNLFIVEKNHNRVRKVSSSGFITMVAGNGLAGYFGDGGAATNASLYYPNSIGIEASGNLFVVDSHNNRIRKVTSIQTPVLPSNNVSLPDAGNYKVVMTGLGGTVSGKAAILAVTNAPFIYQIVLNSNRSVTLFILSQPNSINEVLCTTSLVPPVVWQSISTNIAGADGNWEFTDTNAISFPMRFYRCLTK
jgi:sugar lactone lactonase YvrE